MASPNLLNLTTVIGKTQPATFTTVSSEIIANPLSSAKVYKINSIFVSNLHPTDSREATIEFVRGQSTFKLVSTISIPADTSLVAMGKETTIYLEEGDSLKGYASIAGQLNVIVSYEILG